MQRSDLRSRHSFYQNIGGVCHVLSTSSAAGLDGNWAGVSPNITAPKAQELIDSAKSHIRVRSFCGRVIPGYLSFLETETVVVIVWGNTPPSFKNLLDPNSKFRDS